MIAPAATLNFTNGRVDGSMYAASIMGDGGFNYAPPETPPCPIVPCPPCPSPSPFPPFSLFALSNINMGSSQCNGTLAAGGNVTLTSYAITTPNPATCPLALLAGGGITFSSGGVQGDIVSGALATLSGMSQPSTCNVTQNAGKDAVFNFDTAGTNLLVCAYLSVFSV